MKFTSKLLVMALMSLLLSCTQKPHGSPDELVVAMDAEPKNLNPLLSLDANSQFIGQLVFSSLVSVGKNLTIQGDLADEFSTEDFQTYTFKIRPGAKFHSGEPLDIEAVRRSIDLYRNKSPKNPIFYESFKKIRDMDVVDSQTIKIKLDMPFVGFLTDLSLLKILPKDLDTSKLSGSGPFQVTEQTSFGLKLKRFDDFYGQKAASPKMWIRYIADENTRYMNVLAGDVDVLLGGLSAQRFVSGKADQRLKAYSIPGVTYAYLAFNFSNKKLEDNRIRKAIAHAIDADNIVKNKLLGTVERAGSLFSLQSPYYPGIDPFKYDPEKAKQLLDEAGLKDPDGEGPVPRMTLELKCSSNKEPTELMQLIASDLKKVGIEAMVRPMDPNAFLDALKAGEFEVAYGQWVGVTSPMMLFELFHSSQFPPQKNRGRFASSSLDSVLLRIKSARKEDELKSLAIEAQQKINEELPYVSLWHVTIRALTRSNVSGFEPWPNGSWRALIPVSKSAQ